MRGPSLLGRSDARCSMINVACVWVGDKYPIEYVTRLRSMVARHLPLRHRFVCYTDRVIDCAAARIPYVNVGRVGGPWPGWWSKMALFHPLPRGGHRTIYFDLDTVIIGDISPLAEMAITFGICANFTKRSAVPNYQCNYGSCVMVMAPMFGREVFDGFSDNVSRFMKSTDHKYGDQWAIEQLHPDATLLQDVVPPGFFIGYRDITPTKPVGASVVVFAGSHKPTSYPYDWIDKEWRE